MRKKVQVSNETERLDENRFGGIKIAFGSTVIEGWGISGIAAVMAIVLIICAVAAMGFSWPF